VVEFFSKNVSQPLLHDVTTNVISDFIVNNTKLCLGMTKISLRIVTNVLILQIEIIIDKSLIK